MRFRGPWNRAGGGRVGVRGGLVMLWEADRVGWMRWVSLRLSRAIELGARD